MTTRQDIPHHLLPFFLYLITLEAVSEVGTGSGEVWGRVEGVFSSPLKNLTENSIYTYFHVPTYVYLYIATREDTLRSIYIP